MIWRRKPSWGRRAKESIGMAMIGDGLLATVGPEAHCRLWEKGPRGWKRTVSFFAGRPGLTRTLGVAEAGVGLWLASRQWPS